jgi:UDP-glucose 4-epimerase
MRVLVTGGAGFFGSNVVALLGARGHEVTVLDDLSTGKLENIAGSGARFVHASVNDAAAVDSATQGVDAVLHMAVRNVRESLTNPVANHLVNDVGTLTVLETLRVRHEPKPWFVYCSSSEVYGNTSAELLSDVTTVCRPATVYGASKYAGELLTQAYRETHGQPACVIRPFNVYGPQASMAPTGAELVTRFIAQALRGEPFTVFGDGGQRRDLSWVSDAAAGLVRVVESGNSLSGLTANLGSGFAPTVLEVAREVAQATGVDPNNIAWIEDRPGDVRSLRADISTSVQEFDYHAATSLAEGINRLIDDFRQLIDIGALPDFPMRNW